QDERRRVEPAHPRLERHGTRLERGRQLLVEELGGVDRADLVVSARAHVEVHGGSLRRCDGRRKRSGAPSGTRWVDHRRCRVVGAMTRGVAAPTTGRPRRSRMPNPSIKDEEQYEALRREGASKEKAARISNASAATSRSATGRKGGRSGAY